MYILLIFIVSQHIPRRCVLFFSLLSYPEATSLAGDANHESCVVHAALTGGWTLTIFPYFGCELSQLWWVSKYGGFQE